jgi:hypothetical protein
MRCIGCGREREEEGKRDRQKERIEKERERNMVKDKPPVLTIVKRGSSQKLDSV